CRTPTGDFSDFLDGTSLQIKKINRKAFNWFSRGKKMLNQLARRKALVRGELAGGSCKIFDHGLLLFAQIGVTKLGPYFLRFNLIQASIDCDPRDPVLERHLARKLR